MIQGYEIILSIRFIWRLYKSFTQSTAGSSVFFFEGQNEFSHFFFIDVISPAEDEFHAHFLFNLLSKLCNYLISKSKRFSQKCVRMFSITSQLRQMRSKLERKKGTNLFCKENHHAIHFVNVRTEFSDYNLYLLHYFSHRESQTDNAGFSKHHSHRLNAAVISMG